MLKMFDRMDTKKWPGWVWILVKKLADEDGNHKIFKPGKQTYAKPFRSIDQYEKNTKSYIFPFAFKGPNSIEWSKERKLKYKKTLNGYWLCQVPYVLCMEPEYNRDYFTNKQYKKLKKERVRIKT